MNLLNRGNDLQEFFWPIFHFVKQQILENGSLPLWNNLFFSGTPLLPDPQSPLFYLPNIIFLFLPIGTAFLSSFLLHSLLGGIGTYLAANKGFRLSKGASLFTAALYITSPQIASRAEAGHYGLVLTFTWLPFAVLAAIKLAKEPNFRWSVLLAISLAGLFFTHTLIFLIAAVGASALWAGTLVVAKFISRQERRLKSAITFFFLGAFLAFGLTAVTFLPQLEWQKETTRFLLLEAPDVYPKWTSVRQFFTAVFWPWKAVDSLDTEQWLALGLIPSLLALVGFLHLGRRTKLLVATLVGALTVVALNNASPFYNLLLSQNWYVLMRVATRVWFIPLLIVTFLAAYGLEILQKKKLGRSLIIGVALLAVFELLALSWSRLNIPPPQREFAPREVYEFLQKDEERFRVFCTTRCLFQKDAAEAGLELLEGYGTLQQKNYYSHALQLTGAYWNYYTLALPPIGSYKFEELKPNIKSLGEYNVKYIISPYEFQDKRLTLTGKFDRYFIYKNETVLPRAYSITKEKELIGEAPILKYTPNHVRVDTSTMESPHLVLAEVYSPGWKAYLDGSEEVPVQQTPEALRSVDLKENTEFVDFKYEPKSFTLGRTITFLTILLLVTLAIKNYYTLIHRSV